MKISYSLIEMTMVGGLAAAVFGLHQLALGTQDRRVFASRTSLDEVDARSDSMLSRWDRALRHTTYGRRTAARLKAAGLRMRVVTFTLAMLFAAMIAVFVIWSILAPLFGIVAAGLVGVGFFAYLRRLEDKRAEEFIGQLPDLARVLANASSAGLVARTAIAMAADELAEPAKGELRRVSESLRIGQSMDEALYDLSRRLPSRELSVLVSTLVVSSRSGGSLVTALRNISTTLEERKETRREVRTILGRSIITGYVVVSLSFVAMIGMNFVEGGAIRKMTHSPIGIAILGVVCAMFASGLFIVRRMSRIDV